MILEVKNQKSLFVNPRLSRAGLFVIRVQKNKYLTEDITHPFLFHSSIPISQTLFLINFRHFAIFLSHYYKVRCHYWKKLSHYWKNPPTTGSTDAITGNFV